MKLKSLKSTSCSLPHFLNFSVIYQSPFISMKYTFATVRIDSTLSESLLMRLSSCRRTVSCRMSLTVVSMDENRASSCSLNLPCTQATAEPHVVKITTTADMNADTFFTVSGILSNRLRFAFVIVVSWNGAILMNRPCGCRRIDIESSCRRGMLRLVWHRKATE